MAHGGGEPGNFDMAHARRKYLRHGSEVNNGRD